MHTEDSDGPASEAIWLKFGGVSRLVSSAVLEGNALQRAMVLVDINTETRRVVADKHRAELRAV